MFEIDFQSKSRPAHEAVLCQSSETRDINFDMSIAGLARQILETRVVYALCRRIVGLKVPPRHRKVYRDQLNSDLRMLHTKILDDQAKACIKGTLEWLEENCQDEDLGHMM